MSSENNKQIEAEKTRIFNLIDSAFSDPAPNSWEKYSNLEDFERELGKDFITEYWRDVYNRDVAVTKYVLPFVLKYFAASEKWNIPDEVNVELLVTVLTPSIQQEITGFGDFFEAMYSQYSKEQKEAVCAWLHYLSDSTNDPICGIDKAMEFWCEDEVRSA